MPPRWWKRFDFIQARKSKRGKKEKQTSTNGFDQTFFCELISCSDVCFLKALFSVESEKHHSLGMIDTKLADWWVEISLHIYSRMIVNAKRKHLEVRLVRVTYLKEEKRKTNLFGRFFWSLFYSNNKKCYAISKPAFSLFNGGISFLFKNVVGITG